MKDVVVCSDEVTAGGVRLRYRFDGPPGAPVVMLSNSLGTSAAMWDPQVQALCSYRRVLRYEHRGHGGAPTAEGPWRVEDLGADVVNLLDALGVERVSFAGLSLGGMVGMWVAAQHPERVERLALLCTAADAIPPVESWPQRAAEVRAEGPASLVDRQLGRWFTAGFPERHPEVASLLAGMFDELDADAYACCCEAIGVLAQSPLLPSISAPTLVVAGAADPVTPPSFGLAIAEAIPGAAFSVVPGAAHLATLEQPDRVSALLIDHLVGRPDERGGGVRRAVLGDAHVDRSQATANAFSAPFVDFITRYAWGEVWSRPGLDRRTRSVITLAALASLERRDELALHVAGARRNGLSEEEIAEVLLHVAVYAGVPAANSAFRVAREVLEKG